MKQDNDWWAAIKRAITAGITMESVTAKTVSRRFARCSIYPCLIPRICAIPAIESMGSSKLSDI